MPSATFVDVEVEKVGRVYGRRRALHDVSFRLGAGEAAALLGPNGAGKSTLLSILSTQSEPSSGTVRFGGRPTSPEARAGIGVVAHESLCYGDLTGRENLRFFARLYGVASPNQRADEMLGRLGLDADAADRACRTYSRGMMQRLSVARALIHRPHLVLLDEPFTGLDRDGVAALGRLLVEERERGAILLIVTHDLPAVSEVCQRALVLHRGRLVYNAPLAGRALSDVYQEALPAAG